MTSRTTGAIGDGPELIVYLGYLTSCCRTAVGVGQRALSLSAHTAGGPPPPLLAPGRVASPRHILGV